MTRPKAVAYSRARRPLHLEAAGDALAPLLADYALAAYGGGIAARLKACVSLFARMRGRDANERRDEHA
jgi:hypothetical protein